MADTSVEDAPKPSRADHAMAAIDAALAPVLGHLKADAGPVHASTLIHALSSIRQAFTHLVYGPPDPVEAPGESLDVAGMQKRYSAAYTAYVEQCHADGVEPDDLPTYVANQARDDNMAAGQKEDMELAGYENSDGTLTDAGKAAVDQSKDAAGEKLFA